MTLYELNPNEFMWALLILLFMIVIKD